ncbi:MULTISPECIES: AraC family transcriptional regulator [Clostridium]|uniref:AraC family transcriptional regulator n=1 Tax=Clostridium TaxID=1485 RepID=UPI000AE3A1D7|nr:MULTISPECIES: helix-turn-helix domain-containing protein [Clostridium]MCD2346436.1 AraC family transcriptional regulator [Clostridium guangxiense]
MNDKDKIKLFSIDMEVMPKVRLIGHVNYSTPWKHFTRTISEYVMYFVKNGELYMRENNSDYVLKRGDILLLEPNIEHTGFKASNCHYYYIHFKHNGLSSYGEDDFTQICSDIYIKRKLSLLSNVFSEKPSTDSIHYLPKCYHYKNVSELFSKLTENDYIFYQKLEGYKISASLKFADLLMEICRQYASEILENSHPQFSKSALKIRKIINYLEKAYNCKITSHDIEDLCESNYDYVNRIFQRTTGHTIFNYLNLIRIKQAMDLIYTTSLKYSEIGYLVGINDPYYFSKLFKKYTGMTASQYAKNRCGNSDNL